MFGIYTLVIFHALVLQAMGGVTILGIIISFLYIALDFRNIIIYNINMSLKKFIFNKIILGIVFVSITSIIAIAFTVPFALLIPNVSIIAYVIGGVIGTISYTIFKKFFLNKVNYLRLEEFDNSNKNIAFWIKLAKNKKSIHKKHLLLIYVPFIILSCIMLIILIFSSIKISIGSSLFSSMYYAFLSAFFIASLLYGIGGYRSYSICKKCGAVNSFILVQELDLITANVESSATLIYYNNVYTNIGKRKVGNCGNNVLVQCACCENKSIKTDSWPNKL